MSNEVLIESEIRSISYYWISQPIGRAYSSCDWDEFTRRISTILSRITILSVTILTITNLIIPILRRKTKLCGGIASAAVLITTETIVCFFKKCNASVTNNLRIIISFKPSRYIIYPICSSRKKLFTCFKIWFSYRNYIKIFYIYYSFSLNIILFQMQRNLETSAQNNI